MKIQNATGGNVEVAYADQAYSGEERLRRQRRKALSASSSSAIKTKKALWSCPNAGSVERSFGWIGRCRRLLHDFERLTEVLVGFHLITFAGVMLHQITQLLSNSS